MEASLHPCSVGYGWRCFSSGIHESLDQPPTYSMFKKAGNGDSRRKPEFVTFSTSAAVAISSALAPQTSVPVSQAKTSTAN